MVALAGLRPGWAWRGWLMALSALAGSGEHSYQPWPIGAYKRLMSTTEIVTYCPELDCPCDGAPLVRIHLFSAGSDPDRAREITGTLLRLVGRSPDAGGRFRP